MSKSKSSSLSPTAATTSRPKDQHKLHVWILEPSVVNKDNSNNTYNDSIVHPVLTQDGCEQIAQHQYQGGSYTMLDTYLNPIWTKLTDYLPLWLAPNLVTTFGGCCCFISYLLSLYYNHLLITQQVNTIPRWVYLWNGFALLAYYTLDCMDGKQARRTKSSSPLGQLFDHGIDGMCNVSHVQTIQCIVQLSQPLLVTLQCSLQTAFFQAQWEEYYTGQLPHATGNVGVTEVTYGMALWSLSTCIFGRDFYDYTVIMLNPSNDSDIVQSVLLKWTNGSYELQIRHIASIMWIFMILGLVTLSYIRVYKHLNGNWTIFGSAISKLALGPWLLSLIGIVVNQQSTLALGLAFCMITIKIIVFSMARMAYASFQLSIVPFVLVSLWLQYGHTAGYKVSESVKRSFEWTLDMYYLMAISIWVHRAITQLCDRLQIKLFRIPYPPSSTENEKKKS